MNACLKSQRDGEMKEERSEHDHTQLGKRVLPPPVSAMHVSSSKLKQKKKKAQVLKPPK